MLGRSARSCYLFVAAPPLPRPLPVRHFRHRTVSFLAFFRPASRQLQRLSVTRLPGVGGCSRSMVVSSLERCFPHLLLGSSDLTCSGETARAGPGALARATWQPGGPAPSLAPGPHGGHRLLFGRGWPPRASGPGPALSVLGGAGSGR